MKFIYLHGFASSPRSTKAQDLLDRFTSLGLTLEIPDLNQGNFSHLTLSRQLAQVKALLPENEPVTLIGSSFGGLTAAWLAQLCPPIARLVLLAPAFGFLSYWLPKIDPQQLTCWQAGEPMRVYHYSEQRLLPLHYDFVKDLERYAESHLKSAIPTLILHGTQDDVIPIQASRSYAEIRPWVRLIELESDHALTDQMPQIWQSICQFCDLKPDA
jgi:hypothetical protein